MNAQKLIALWKRWGKEMISRTTRAHVIVVIVALLINTSVLFVMPLIKYVRQGQLLEGDLGRSGEVKITKVSLDEKKKKIKKVKIKTTKPKLTKKTQQDSRFKLDFGIGSYGEGATLSGRDSANLVYNEGDVEVDPVRISGRDPEVPDAFAAAELEGRVELQVIINADGRVSELEVVLENPPNYQLGRSAAAAMRTWKYRPAMIKGIPVRIRVIVPFIFS